MSQIISINQEILSFRHYIATYQPHNADLENNEIAAEDPLLPSTSFRIAGKDTLPRELPTHHEAVEDSEAKENKKEAEDDSEIKTKSNNANEKSDNLSAVSMGTSSLSSSSAASESAEDQDVILVNGQASPTSAMSISPATSEVCSILSHHGSSRNVANAGHVTNNQLNSSKKKKNHSRASHQRQSNVDLVLDWRAPSSAKNAPTGTPPKSPKALSADDDTNWREHNHESSDKNSKPDAGDSNDWRTVTKNRKINDNNSKILLKLVIDRNPNLYFWPNRNQN